MKHFFQIIVIVHQIERSSLKIFSKLKPVQLFRLYLPEFFKRINLLLSKILMKHMMTREKKTFYVYMLVKRKVMSTSTEIETNRYSTAITFVSKSKG